MEKLEAREFVKKYLSGDLSFEEKMLADQWFAKNLADSDSIPDQLRIIKADERMRANLNRHLLKDKKGRWPIQLWTRIAAAAVVLIVFSFCMYLILTNNAENRNLFELKSGDILPATNKAILTLSDGKKVILSATNKGTIAEQGGSEITKNDGEAITYKAAEATSQQVLYNTMSTPRGGTYKLILADGTTVILNAMSSITYPTAFIGKERKVTLVGEAYFFVAHNAEKPFKVVSGRQTVQVLGTQFNVNAYQDEPAITTTLVSGKVRISNDVNKTTYLKPGQQAKITTAGLSISTVDVNEAVAWKDGIFHFNNADIPTVMRTLSRWYDVSIEYQGSPTNRRFTGDIYTDIPISKALAIISYLKIRFKVQDKKIIVIL